MKYLLINGPNLNRPRTRKPEAIDAVSLADLQNERANARYRGWPTPARNRDGQRRRNLDATGAVAMYAPVPGK